MSDANVQTATTTGLASMEAEHEEQFRLLDALENALRRGVEAHVVDTMMLQLIDHTNVHFLSEQLLMRLHAYEAYEQHLQEHDQLMAEVRGLRERFNRGEAADLQSFIAALRNWLTVHIHTTDSVLGAYLSAQSAPMPPMEGD